VPMCACVCVGVCGGCLGGVYAVEVGFGLGGWGFVFLWGSLRLLRLFPFGGVGGLHLTYGSHLFSILS
jgi:hypothetical protein